MDEDAHRFEVFFDVQRGLPRQGPGSAECTRRALSMCSELPDRPAVLDIGCGPGMQTRVLATALGVDVTAADNCMEYLVDLKTRADRAGLAERIHVVGGDMQALPFPDRSVDLIWAEGSAYVMGFEAALRSWKNLLKSRGYVAVSELVWLEADPPAEAAAFFGDEYPAMTDIDTNLATIRGCGYELIGHFTLPDSAWWDDYYTPLDAKMPALMQKYADDEDALEIVEMTRKEIEMRRRFAHTFGYVFFVARFDQ